MRRRVAASLPAAISLASLAAVVWWSTRQEAPSLPLTSSAVATVAAALAVYTAATAARGERWHRILVRAGIPVARDDSYRLVAIGYMGNNVLPARGGDLLRPVLLAPLAGARKRAVLGTVVAERVLDVIALVAIFLVVAIVVVQEAELPGGWIVPVAVLAGAAGALAAAVFAVRAFADHPIVEDVLRPVAAASRDLLSAHGAALLGLSLVVWALESLVYWTVAESIGLHFGPFDALYIVALTNLFALVPSAPAYVGTFDAAVLFAVGSLGAAGADGLAYLILLRFVLFVPITLAGLILLLTRYGGWSRYRAAHGGGSSP